MKFFGMIFVTTMISLNAMAVEVYQNASGCSVEVEATAKGVRYLIADDKGKLAMLGALNDLSVGDIKGFCKNANVVMSDNVLVLGCNDDLEAGAYPTRGFAEVDLTNGVSSVEVEGQYKRFGFWKTDTKIECYNLKRVK